MKLKQDFVSNPFDLTTAFFVIGKYATAKWTYTLKTQNAIGRDETFRGKKLALFVSFSELYGQVFVPN